MDEILILLARKNAHKNPIKITTSELGDMLGMSQQNASRRLASLEKAGLLRKTTDGVLMTQEGVAKVYGTYADLKSIFEKKPEALEGTIVSGFGEGKYYLSFGEYKNQISDKFGFAPYEGTLNIRLAPEMIAAKSFLLKNSEPLIINGFKKQGRTFGDLFTYPCSIESVKCALVVPARTHHPPDIIEVVSSSNLKKALEKKDGSKVRVVFE